MQSASLNQGTMDLQFYWRQIRKRPWVILAFVLVGLVLGGLRVAKTRPLYQATAKILIERERPKIAPFEELMVSGQTASHYETQYQILQSRALARRVIDQLGLRSHPEFAPKPAPPPVAMQDLQSWLGSLKQTFKSWLFQPQETEKPDALPAAVPAPDSALVDAFLSRLVIKANPKAHLVNVSFTAHHPGLAANAINTLARLYIDFNMETRFAELQDALDWLQNQVGDMRQQVETSEQALQQYKDEYNMHLIDDRLPGLVQEITVLSTSLTQAKTQRIEFETLYHEFKRAVKIGESVEWMPAVVDNALIQNLKTRYVDLQRTYIHLGQKYGDEHPRVAQLQAQLTALQVKIDQEVEQIVQAFESQYQVAQARERALAEHIDSLQQEVRQLNTKAVQYGVLKRDAESNLRLSDLLLNRLKEASVSSDLTSGNNIRIIDPAEVPSRPINVRTTRTLGMAALLGLFVGVGLVAFIGYLDNTLKTPEEAEEFLGFPIVGVIEQFRARRGSKEDQDDGLVTRGAPHSRSTEAFKTLRANLLFSYTDLPRKVFLISSPHPHDGKTTVAANLAMVMAQTERRVLLVDADLRNPSLHRLFAVENRNGLSEQLLTETYTPTIEVGDDGLSMITAGVQPLNPSELLESKRMQRFLAFAREHYDIVIIDSPPILAVSDALVLSPYVDGILVVLRAGATPYDHARRAIASFLTLQADPLVPDDQETSDRKDTTSLGLVMNFLDPREGASYGYYGYHSYYGHRPEPTNEQA